MTIIYDRCYFVSKTKENKIIKQNKEVCFGEFNRNPETYITKDATTLEVFFGFYSTHKTAQVYIEELYKSKVFQKTWGKIEIVPKEKAPTHLMTRVLHSKCKEFVKCTFKVTKTNLQTIYTAFYFARLLQNTPDIVYYFRKSMPIPMDFLTRLLIVSNLIVAHKSIRLTPVSHHNTDIHHKFIVGMSAVPNLPFKSFRRILKAQGTTCLDQTNYDLFYRGSQEYYMQSFYNMKQGKTFLTRDITKPLKNFNEQVQNYLTFLNGVK